VRLTTRARSCSRRVARRDISRFRGSRGSCSSSRSLRKRGRKRAEEKGR